MNSRNVDTPHTRAQEGTVGTMRATFAIACVVLVLGMTFAAPTAVAREDPPVCVRAPCCPQGDVWCEIEHWAGDLKRLVCIVFTC